MIRIFSIILSIGLALQSQAQQNKPATLISHPGTNLRGLSISGNTIWVSGSKGQIGRSPDAGRTWKWCSPKGFEARDFRDIQALGATTAIAIAIDTPAVILKTTDGGDSWQTVYENNTPGMFLDAVDFSDEFHGIVVGDPVDGKIFLATTTDAGEHWTRTDLPSNQVRVAKGEAFFAASGSNIHLGQDGRFLLVSGGTKSRLWTPQHTISIPTMMQGGATKGANGLDVKGDIIAIAGGDFSDPARPDSCFALSYDGGKSWQRNGKTPRGYISGVCIISKVSFVICGLSGAWITTSGGKDWRQINGHPFNAVSFDKTSQIVYLAGPGGVVDALPLNPAKKPFYKRAQFINFKFYGLKKLL